MAISINGKSVSDSDLGYGPGDPDSKEKTLLRQWSTDKVERKYKNTALLKKDLEAAASGRRENYFYNKEGEDRNIHTVIHTTTVPMTSIGFSQTEFFENLGNPINARYMDEDVSIEEMVAMISNDDRVMNPSAADMLLVTGGLKRRAEQEYILQNMVKGALFEAAEIATLFGMGIAVRGTGVLAHMGIESGDPTKSQEFKNKTSKVEDLWLCDELEWGEIGTVVHYDPRPGWTSAEAAKRARNSKPPMYWFVATESDWREKWGNINENQKLKSLILAGRIAEPNEVALKKVFFNRSKEYMEQDYEYRRGHYAPHTTLDGPKIRLKMRPDSNIVGDHDLFLFTQNITLGEQQYGRPALASYPQVPMIQTALQSASTFQAQHGGIWYWEPTTTNNQAIKKKIMDDHSPNGSEPLIYIQPDNIVSAAYYVPESRTLSSVWDDESWTKWMAKTHSGELFLKLRSSMRRWS